MTDGDLGQVARDRSVATSVASYEERLRFYRQLLWIALEKGYAVGWARHKHREKFGAWPAVWDADPMPPDAATRSWVKSRQIAYAKAQRRDPDHRGDRP